MLSQEDLHRFRDRLEAERHTLESRIAANRRGVQETVRDEEGVGDAEDDADLLYEREEELGENARDRQELEQVRRALERIDQGTYGVSEVSGRPIPKERLEALPHATTLVGERPVEPD